MSIQDEINQSINSATKTVSQNDITKLASEAEDKIRQGIKVVEQNTNLNETKKQKKVPSTAKWKTKTFGQLLPTSLVKSVQTEAKTAVKSLETVTQTLNAAKEFVSILEPFEAAITDPIGNLGSQILKEIEALTKNARSTGVYILDLFSHYYIGDTKMLLPANFTKLGDEGIQDKQNSDLKDYLEQNEYDIDFIKLENNSLDSLSSSQEKSKFQNDLNNIKSPIYLFKPTTYEDFIETIANAFLDPNDLPSGAISKNKIMVRSKLDKDGNPVIQKPASEAKDVSSGNVQNNTKESQATQPDSIQQSTDFNNKVKQINESTDISKWEKYRIFNSDVNFNPFTNKPGRPQFGPGSYSKVYVIAVTAPDLKSYLNKFNLLSQLFKTGFTNFLEGQKTEEVTNFLDTWHEFFGDLKKLVHQPGELSEKEKDFAHMATVNNATSPISEGEPPDFYGVSLYSLMPSVFGSLDNLNTFLRELTNNPSSTFSELVSAVIDMVQRKIDKLNRLVKVLDSLISFLDDLLKISVTMLEISSTKGVYDIYDQLMNSDTSAFPNAGSGKTMYVGGYAFAFGTVTSTKLNIDFQTYIQDRNVQFDEVKGQLDTVKTKFPGGLNFFEKIIKAFK